MYESFNARLNLNECAEIRKVRYSSGHYVALVETLVNGVPRISGNLLHAEGDSVLLAVDSDDFHRNFVALLEHVLDLERTLPCDFSEVNEAVHLPDVYEDSEISEA